MYYLYFIFQTGHVKNKDQSYTGGKTVESSLKAYYKEFKKVIPVVSISLVCDHCRWWMLVSVVCDFCDLCGGCWCLSYVISVISVACDRRSHVVCGPVQVVDAADVVLEVLDARDPLGSRCPQVEEAVLAAGSNKKLVLVLNKIGATPHPALSLRFRPSPALGLRLCPSPRPQSETASHPPSV